MRNFVNFSQLFWKLLTLRLNLWHIVLGLYQNLFPVYISFVRTSYCSVLTILAFSFERFHALPHQYSLLLQFSCSKYHFKGPGGDLRSNFHSTIQALWLLTSVNTQSQTFLGICHIISIISNTILWCSGILRFAIHYTATPWLASRGLQGWFCGWLW